jgi:DNA-binding protein Fis
VAGEIQRVRLEEDLWDTVEVITDGLVNLGAPDIYWSLTQVVQRAMIDTALNRYPSEAEAARMLGINRGTLRKYLGKK